ncbi:cytochrome P450 [Nonomuraea sp. NPDC050643]|uniref:cytochrome P450 family protein n=1 Tax=Nonomuraea sp. NPDC050643 TaxID=3155660 RepID=UPI0033CFCCD4
MGHAAADRPLVIDPTGRDIHAEAERIRALGPAVRVELPGGVPVWAVCGQEQLRLLLTDPRVSKDAHRHWAAWIRGEVTAEWQLFPWVGVRNMFTAYGPDHRRLRGLVSSAFTARRTAALRPRIEEIVEVALDELAGVARGNPVDLREYYAYPIPVNVICELFGVTDADTREQVRRCVDAFFRTAADRREAAEAYPRIQGILRGLIAGKREHPGDDLSSALIAARDGGSRLSEDELVATLSLFLSAGHESTVNLLDHAIAALLTHPGQLDLVRTGQVTWEAVIEETLRHQAPVASIPLRYAVEDIDLGDGITLRAGDAILACYAAAGRDPLVHGHDADRFDVTRPAKDHLSLGHGAHHCLGAPLARLEALVALPALFARHPGLTLAADPGTLAPMESFISNGHRTLPVRLGP